MDVWPTSATLYPAQRVARLDSTQTIEKLAHCAAMTGAHVSDHVFHFQHIEHHEHLCATVSCTNYDT